MAEKIVVPLDGSVTAEAILPYVRRFLRLEDAEAVFVRAENPAPVENYVPVAEAALAAGREYVAGIRERYAGEGARARAVARLGPPARVILEVIEEEKATLVAMATHGRTGLQRLLFGSVAEQVLRKSPVPVFVVRPFWTYEIAAPDRGIRTILVPLDGSGASRAVLPVAAEWARLYGARIVLLHALTPEEGGNRELAKAFLEEAATELRKASVETSSVLKEADPARLVQDAARFHHADLIAMTTHGRSGVARLVTGSVTEQVLREAMVPMLIVRSEAAAPEAGHAKAAGRVKGGINALTSPRPRRT